MSLPNSNPPPTHPPQLASKIIKGRFPPISSRYSAHLKDLITAMLQTNPNKRPSIER